MLIWNMTGAEDGNKPIIKEIAIGAMWEENKKKIPDVIHRDTLNWKAKVLCGGDSQVDMGVTSSQGY